MLQKSGSISQFTSNIARIRCMVCSYIEPREILTRSSHASSIELFAKSLAGRSGPIPAATLPVHRGRVTLHFQLRRSLFFALAEYYYATHSLSARVLRRALRHELTFRLLSNAEILATVSRNGKRDEATADRFLLETAKQRASKEERKGGGKRVEKLETGKRKTGR